MLDRLTLVETSRQEPGPNQVEIEVEATAATGLDVTSYVQCELIRSINRDRLVHRLGTTDEPTNTDVTTIVKTLLNH